jgi:hypothetical protein
MWRDCTQPRRSRSKKELAQTGQDATTARARESPRGALDLAGEGRRRIAQARSGRPRAPKKIVIPSVAPPLASIAAASGPMVLQRSTVNANLSELYGLDQLLSTGGGGDHLFDRFFSDAGSSAVAEKNAARGAAGGPRAGRRAGMRAGPPRRARRRACERLEGSKFASTNRRSQNPTDWSLCIVSHSTPAPGTAVAPRNDTDHRPRVPRHLR